MRLFIGIGCRASVREDAIVALVEECLGDALPLPVCGLFTLAEKAGFPAMQKAASLLAVPLEGLSRDALAAVTVATPSQLVKAHLGLEGVAEAAALAAAGRGASLIVPKRKGLGVTCAIARGEGK